MLIICEDTLRNTAALETRAVPRKFLGRVAVLPRKGGWRLWLRILVEMQFLRYLVALIPFAILPFTAHSAAAAVTQAPLAMVLVIAVVELRVLRLSEKQRERLLDEDEVARRLDRLAFRGKAALRRVAARRGVASGDLHLVIEQSELARVAALTLVTVQAEQPAPHVVALDAGDRAAIAETLFDAAFTERDLMEVNQRTQVFIRDIAQDARGVSAHARLAAALEKRGSGALAGA